MRFALLLLLLNGCVAAQPFELTVTNDGDGHTFLAAGEGSGVLVGISEEMNGVDVPLITSLAFLCMEQCGVPGQVVCADVAAQLAVVQALMPGDSVSKSFDGEFWYRDDLMNCARQAPLTGALSANLCHGTSYTDANTGEVVDTATESGIVGGNGGASVNGDCELFPFTLDDPTVSIVEE